MDSCLRRLKQELLSLREAGDGLHAQMTSLMGAVQELKLLQVQTALERLEISHNSRRCPPPANTHVLCPAPASEGPARCTSPEHEGETPPSREGPVRGPHRNSLDTSPSMSSLASGTSSSSSSSCSSSSSSSSSSSCSSESTSGSGSSDEDEDPPQDSTFRAELQHPHQIAPIDLPGILYSLSREGPSLDVDYPQDSTGDDSSDWTSSLMSSSRNRQPLVLGDTVLADLVGNWLDLPDQEKEKKKKRGRKKGEEKGAGQRRGVSANPLQRSHSQEMARKFSLTASFFRKFLRSVRPDRDKLLKERPGWMPLDDPDTELSKRPKKPKASFYPFRTSSQQAKGRLAARPVERRGQNSAIYIDRVRSIQVMGPVPPIIYKFDTAVWV